MKDYIPEGFVFAAGAFLQYQLTFLPVRTDIFHDLTFILLCGLRMFLFSFGNFIHHFLIFGNQGIQNCPQQCLFIFKREIKSPGSNSGPFADIPEVRPGVAFFQKFFPAAAD